MPLTTPATEEDPSKKMKRRDRVRMINLSERVGANVDELDLLVNSNYSSSTFSTDMEGGRIGYGEADNMKVKRRDRVRMLQAQVVEEDNGSSFRRIVCMTGVFFAAVVILLVWYFVAR